MSVPPARQHPFIAALGSRPAFAVACGLLVVQLVLAGYSYSERARSVLWANEDGRIVDAVGVSETRWVLVRTLNDPSATGNFWRREFLGSGYATVPGVYFVVLLHMAWTIIPTMAVAGFGARARALSWWANRCSASWRRRGLCGACGYDIRASRERCPECGHSLQDQPPQ